MWKSLASPAALLLMLVLALTSVTSAAMMAPERGDPARMAHEMTFGAEMHDICGAGHHQGHGDHACPFCHGLPEAPALGHAGLVSMLTPVDGRLRADHLWRAAQTRNINHSPRAPPRKA